MSESLRDQIARTLESLECWCGHRKNQHDPEDGRCEAGVQLSNCPCLGFHTPDPDRTTAEYQADAVLPLVEAEIERRKSERAVQSVLEMAGYRLRADAAEARLAEVRRERDDLEVSMATVAAGFERARARIADLRAALHVASGRVRWLHRVVAVDWAPDEEAALVRDLNLIDAALAPGGES